MDNSLLQSKDYYIDLIHSTKANKFTSYYHYSGVGFKKAKINQGIYRKDNNLLVGVLQWGCSAQEGIRLDRYVNEPITTAEYLELNRFCMADSEGKNAESQAIALGIKWIKRFRPDIRLLVSYAGRKEGNYGYIYQATSWEYLGYFLSPGFWILDGVEKHQITVYYIYKRHCDTNLPFLEGIKDHFNSVIQTWTKQFIYIKRLDKTLTTPVEPKPYPKPANEFPICTRTRVLKNEPYETPDLRANKVIPTYYYEKETTLFCKEGRLPTGNKRKKVAVYSFDGDLEFTTNTVSELVEQTGIGRGVILNRLQTKKEVNGLYFRYFTDEPLNSIDDMPYVAIIDGIKFERQIDVANYCEVSRQAVSQSYKLNGATIGGKKVIWFKEGEN